MPDVTVTEAQIKQGLAAASSHELAFLSAEQQWIVKGRTDQILPLKFTRALVMTGRGWGKTHTAASWSRRCAGLMPGSIGHVVAPTFGDLRGTVFEGVSGLLSVIPPAMVASYNKTYYEIKFVNGTWLRGFSAEEPDRLRGPQCHWLWGDEVAHWQYLQETIDNIDFSTRLVYERKNGDTVVERVQPMRLYTTTPLPLELIRDYADTPHGTGVKEIYQVRGTLYDNKDNLAESFIADVAKHEGTKLGDQEIYGKVIDFDESAIIKKSWLKLWPHNRQLPQFEIIVASYDTALTEETYDKDSQKADPTACLVFGIFLFEGRINALVLNAWDKRLGMPDLIEHAKEEARIEYGHMEPVSPTTYVEAQAGKPPTMVRVPKKVSLSIIEDIGGGRAARQMLEKEKLPMFAYNPGRASKLERINVVAHIVKSGRLWLHESATPDKHGKPKHASWADPFVAQVCQYTGPGSTIHDDYVDSLSQFLRWFADNYLPGSAADKIRRPAPPPPPAPNPYGG